MVSAITWLLVFQLAGEILARGLNLTVPGPVLGMILLFLTLALRGGPSEEFRTTSQGLLQHLSLLFVPAGTGILLHLHRVADEWVALLVSLVAGTLATLAVTAWTMKYVQSRTGEGGGRGPPA